MNIYDFKNVFENSSGELEKYVDLESPYSQQALVNQKRIGDILSSIEIITSSILEPANSWETSLNKDQDSVESDNVMDCHTNLLAVQSGVANSIQNLSSQLSCIEGTTEELENSSYVINQAFQSRIYPIDKNTYDNLKTAIDNTLDELSDFRNFCQLIISDMQNIIDILDLGSNPYDYEMYNSATILKMQITTCFSDIQTLRTDFFE